MKRAGGLCFAALTAAISALTSVPAQAQMYHLYLHCEGTVAAGPAASSPEQTAVVPRGGSGGTGGTADTRSVGGDASSSDKNRIEGDENSQARAKAVRSARKRGDAQLELALRDNNMSMLVQRSNVLPTGQKLSYQATNTHYTATFLPLQAGAAFHTWGREGGLFGFYPPFQKMQATRFSIDRQTGVLEGDIVGPNGELLGLIDMQCEPRRPEDAPKPRF
ncbi:hypothetical protein [Inhella sp.]|uniref:hypothetical protein n=1 Tax=Inhella sp. TaxID=1921806 RepID=UPI0035B375BD